MSLSTQGAAKMIADACGEVPTIPGVSYNIARLRAIGYLSRFDGYLRQLGFDDAERAEFSSAMPSEIDTAVARVAERAWWGSDPEAHLTATGCGTVLVVADDAGHLPGVEPPDQLVALDRFAAMEHDISMLLGVDPTRTDALDVTRELLDHPACAGLALSPFLYDLAVDDPAWEPFLDLADETATPVWVHASAHFRTDVAYDIGHPGRIDNVLRRRPDLRVIIGHAGWPWVADACILAVRHPSVALEFSTFPPRLIADPGWSLSPLLANQDALVGRIFFGSGQTSAPKRFARMLHELDGLKLGDQLDQWRGAGLLTWLGAA